MPTGPRIDVVTIGAPDHWHARMLINACRAGNDVYRSTVEVARWLPIRTTHGHWAARSSKLVARSQKS